jgi:hypothetical protein
VREQVSEAGESAKGTYEAAKDRAAQQAKRAGDATQVGVREAGWRVCVGRGGRAY